MATAVASRFAVLSVDAEDDFPRKGQQKKKTEKKSAPGSQKSDANQKKKTKKTDSSKQQQHQQQKHSNTKAKTKSSAKGNDVKQGSATNKKKATPEDQWDEWKEKDSEFVEGSYERDLHQAILLSKLDYESHEQEKQPGSSGGNKRSKKQQNRPQPMSLEQFNTLVDSNGFNDITDSLRPMNEQPLLNVLDQIENDNGFLEQIHREVKSVLDREYSEDLRKAREPFVQEVMLVAQLQDALEKKNQETERLKQEIVQLKEELLNVRTRNKKLCQILADGEMKDKAEVLLEVDRLQQMRDELSSEVSTLHTLLEQERSKVRALTCDAKNKSQNKKRTTSETAQ